jgi:hypothetical protein
MWLQEGYFGHWYGKSVRIRTQRLFFDDLIHEGKLEDGEAFGARSEMRKIVSYRHHKPRRLKSPGVNAIPGADRE